MRYLFASVLFFSLLFPSFAHAAVDMRCFTEAECIKKRELFMSKADAKINPLYQGTDAQKACGGEKNKDKEKVGFCYPAGNATTRISFAGQTNFSNIGEFIQFGYRLAVVVAGLIAVIMLIIAGFQWTTSGGSAEAIKSAQKRIANALMGLILAVLSFFILYTINPYLINLRLPQAWMINDIPLETEFCSGLPNTETFAKAPQKDGTIDTAEFANASFTAKYDAKEKDFEKTFACGDQLFYKSGKGNTCRGDVCPKFKGYVQTCVKDTEKYECKKGNIVGKITNPTMSILSGWEDRPDALDDFETFLICKDGKAKQVDINEHVEVSKGETSALYQVYLEAHTKEKAEEACKNSEPVGLLMYPDVKEDWDPTDEAHVIGINPAKPNDAFDLGENLASIANLIKDDKEIKGKPAKNYLIPLSAFWDGYQLNINVGNIEDND